MYLTWAAQGVPAPAPSNQNYFGGYRPPPMPPNPPGYPNPFGAAPNMKFWCNNRFNPTISWHMASNPLPHNQPLRDLPQCSLDGMANMHPSHTSWPGLNPTSGIPTSPASRTGPKHSRLLCKHSQSHLSNQYFYWDLKRINEKEKSCILAVEDYMSSLYD